MRFLADMGVSFRIVNWLRSEGHDAIHLRYESLQTLPDEEIFEKPIREQRVVLTFDLDFSEIIAAARGELVSVILFRTRSTRAEFLIGRLQSVLIDASAHLSSGAIIIVEDGRHRIRKLPVGDSGIDTV